MDPFQIRPAARADAEAAADGGFYCADPVAEAQNAGAPEDTQDSELAYARFDRTRATRYPPGLLPGEAGDHFG